jgi:hypothetical protein
LLGSILVVQGVECRVRAGDQDEFVGAGEEEVGGGEADACVGVLEPGRFMGKTK